MGKSTISMAIFNSYVSLPGRVALDGHNFPFLLSLKKITPVSDPLSRVKNSMLGVNYPGLGRAKSIVTQKMGCTMGSPINQLVEEGDSIQLCIIIYIYIYIIHIRTGTFTLTHSQFERWKPVVDGCFGPPAGNVNLFISSDPPEVDPSGLDFPMGNLISIVVYTIWIYLVYFPIFPIIYPSFSRNHRKMYPIFGF